MSIRFFGNKPFYSPRSQRILLEEKKLLEKGEGVESLITHSQKKIADLESEKARLVAIIADPSFRNYGQLQLSETLKALDSESRMLKAYEDERLCIQAKIDALALSPEAAQVRAKEQEHLAELCSERAQKDAEIDQTLRSLRNLLDERRELTVKIAESAKTVDLAVANDSLHSQPFDDLLSSLPEGLGPASKRWLECFLGEAKDAETYVLIDEFLVMPETLADHGVHRFGDRIRLAPEQARQVVRSDGSVPSVVTVEQFEATARSAANSGFTAEDAFAYQRLDHLKRKQEELRGPRSR